MLNNTFTGQNGKYIISKEIGKGGEGAVYELENYSDLVLKIYSEPITSSKIRKLKLMTSMSNSQLEKYVAFVKDVVSDSKGNVCGFAMKKLSNYVPLHMLFSPMDRKKIFPDKGYNFLVHVARNLATAFHSCHEAGLIIGDVNEGNILVNSQGMIALIDCDSFQIKDGSSYHFCEVGIPRYTPPELLEKTTFDNVIRTTNTDSFSMAVLIFQLLFLGRHPFAGKNNSKEDIDEETAIKKYWFAFSIRNRFNKLMPPNDSYDIKNLTDKLSDLFHSSFEKREDRPKPINYVKELGTYLNDLVICKKSSIHWYPSELNHCIWCIYQENRNILYFLDDNFIKIIPSLYDIESFVNGFKVEKISFQKIEFPSSSSNTLTPSPIDKKFSSFKWYQRMILAIPILLGIGLSFISYWFIFFSVIVAFVIKDAIPWNKKIKEELEKRKSECLEIKGKLESAIKEFNYPVELRNYEIVAKEIETKIVRFKNLPNELKTKRKNMEEKLYSDQLNKFLSSFEIEDYSIPSFGATRKWSLYNAGIKNASEISKLNTIKVQGIGPKFEQILFSWQRQVSSKFIYHPDNNLIKKEINLILSDIEKLKKNLENEIKKDYHNLQILKCNISDKQEQLKRYIGGASKQYFQLGLDYQSFKKFVSL